MSPIPLGKVQDVSKHAQVIEECFLHSVPRPMGSGDWGDLTCDMPRTTHFKCSFWPMLRSSHPGPGDDERG